jgi:elongation factor 1-alpha
MTNNSFFGKLSWPQIVERSAKIVNFYDLGGSEKALKCSIKAISPKYLDYLALVISASSGITNDTAIFLKMALVMDLPVLIIITKIDLLEEDDQSLFLNNLYYIIKAQKSKKNPLVAKNQEDIVLFSRSMIENIIPIFLVSNKTGKGLDLLINFLNVLPTKIPDLTEYDKRSNIQV